jgi:hypothetical protein
MNLYALYQDDDALTGASRHPDAISRTFWQFSEGPDIYSLYRLVDVPADIAEHLEAHGGSGQYYRDAYEAAQVASKFKSEQIWRDTPEDQGYVYEPAWNAESGYVWYDGTFDGSISPDYCPLCATLWQVHDAEACLTEAQWRVEVRTTPKWLGTMIYDPRNKLRGWTFRSVEFKDANLTMKAACEIAIDLMLECVPHGTEVSLVYNHRLEWPKEVLA